MYDVMCRDCGATMDQSDTCRHADTCSGDPSATIARLTAERDEARAELARLRNDNSALATQLDMTRQIATEKADEVARLREALRPFAMLGRNAAEGGTSEMSIASDLLIRARAALAKPSGEG